MDARQIGMRLRDLRGDMTQEEAAFRLEISLFALKQYEEGVRVPRDEVKLRMCALYETTLEGLFFPRQVHKT